MKVDLHLLNFPRHLVLDPLNISQVIITILAVFTAFALAVPGVNPDHRAVRIESQACLVCQDFHTPECVHGGTYCKNGNVVAEYYTWCANLCHCSCDTTAAPVASIASVGTGLPRGNA